MACRGRHLLTPSEAVGLLWPKAIAKHHGVEGLRRMKMRIGPIHARRVTAVNIWRIGLLGQHLFGCLLVKGGKFLRKEGSYGQSGKGECQSKPRPFARSNHVRLH